MNPEILSQLRNLSSQSGLIYSLAILLVTDLCYSLRKETEINWHERINIQEFTFLISLMLRTELELKIPPEETVNRQCEVIRELFNGLHTSHFDEALKDVFSRGEEGESALKRMPGTGSLIRESIFYGGTGAYDFQCCDLSRPKYKHDLQWLKENKNLKIEDLVNFYNFLKDFQTEKIRKRPKPKSFSELCEIALSIFCFERSDIPQNLAYLLDEFTISSGAHHIKETNPGQYSLLESKPIIKIGSDLYFLPLIFHLSKSIYESPFYWMLEDKAYQNKMFQNRGQVAVDMAYDILLPVFGVGNLYKDVKIIKNKKEILTDIDLFAFKGNKTVAFQIKSKRLTELSRLGDENALKKDFTEAIQKAYQQGLVCRNAILNKQNEFVLSSGEKIKLEDSINDVYIVCLTLDDYPSAVQQVKSYLEKDDEAPWPLAISIFDLEILAFYLNNPYKFLYYLRQRIALHETFTADTEIALLGFHLKKKLFVKKNDETPDSILIGNDFAQLIDANFPVEKGFRTRTKSAEELYPKWRNVKFEQLIENIAKCETPQLMDAIFFLYDISSDAADALIEQVERAKRRALAAQSVKSITFLFDNKKNGLSYGCYFPKSNEMDDGFLDYCQYKKYESKADLWIGLIGSALSENLVDGIVFSHEPWRFDAMMEAVAYSAESDR